MPTHYTDAPTRSALSSMTLAAIREESRRTARYSHTATARAETAVCTVCSVHRPVRTIAKGKCDVCRGKGR